MSEKQGHISDKKRLLIGMQSIENRLLNRVYGAGRSSVFSQDGFLDLGSRVVVDKALSRLAAKGTLRRLARYVKECIWLGHRTFPRGLKQPMERH